MTTLAKEIKPAGLKTSGINISDKLGYALGDAGCLLVFGLVGSLLQKFYTDILFIDAGKITLLFLLARVWDAINDPLMGRLVDVVKPTSAGKYKPWLVRMAVPMAISTVLLFMKFPGMTMGGKLAYAYVTYILFGMIYTTINIPYGSLASVITSDVKERSTLSILRSVGSGVGGIGAMVLSGLSFSVALDPSGAPILDANNDPIKVMDWNKLIIGVSVLAFFSIICYLLCYKMTKERITPEPYAKQQKGVFANSIKSLIKSRPFLSLCTASMLLIAGQMFLQSLGLYIMDDYFNKPEMNIVLTLSTYIPMVVVMLFTNKLVMKYGKREVCGFGMLFAGVVFLILMIIKTTNVWVFVSLAFLAGAGISFFILEVWAFVTDAIDFQLVKTKKRDETNTYAVFSFTRKLGQTLAGVLSTQVIAWVGYNALNLIQTDATKSQIYLWGTLIPALLFIVSGIMLIFWYPLNKKKMDELQEAKISLYETSAAETDALNSFLDDIYTGKKNDNKVEIPGAEYISDSDEGRADE